MSTSKRTALFLKRRGLSRSHPPAEYPHTWAIASWYDARWADGSGTALAACRAPPTYTSPSDLHEPSAALLSQVESFGVHVSHDGTLIMGARIDAIHDRLADNISVDFIARCAKPPLHTGGLGMGSETIVACVRVHCVCAQCHVGMPSVIRPSQPLSESAHT